MDHRVLLVDGLIVDAPDTPENQFKYPQTTSQKPGLGFPLARIAAVFSLACGAVLDVGICRYAGKGQSELGMLRTLWNLFRPGDDFVLVPNGKAMQAELDSLLKDDAARNQIAANGLETIRKRHTCDHRAQQLTEICEELVA